ncbi:hypothetical protein EVAR_21254_1 [Eumeta japonica]|uniref:Uncharacterized protein n=1 Tax=Eumeta variegata TaxID=151549 RepID=A0A4C1WPV1_EUMVA|nr:hypothetical protein EVAR_21254_1 [Eumeta japonica]
MAPSRNKDGSDRYPSLNSDPGPAFHSHCDPAPDLTLFPFSSSIPVSNFNSTSYLVCNFNSAPDYSTDLDENVANAKSIKLKFGLYYSVTVQLSMRESIFRILEAKYEGEGKFFRKPFVPAYNMYVATKFRINRINLST